MTPSSCYRSVAVVAWSYEFEANGEYGPTKVPSSLA